MNAFEKSDLPVCFSIFVITYNHEFFIEQALNSIVQQKFLLKTEIVVGIDKSTDNTALVCRKFKEEHPEENIRLLEWTENIGMYENFKRTLYACRGKYIAILEGDDYWIDPLKLKKQFDLFEAEPNCILSGSFTENVDEKSNVTKRPRLSPFKKGTKYLQEDLLLSNRFPTLTVAFRAHLVDQEKLDKLNSSPHLDWPFFLSLRYKPGDYFFLFNEVFGAYRFHTGGLYSLIQEEKKLLNTAKTVAAIHNIMSEKHQHLYARSLYCNLLKRHRALLLPDLNDFFDESFLIYHRNWVTFSFLKKASLEAFQYLIKGDAYKFPFKSKMELVRQTKHSKKNYLQLMLSPLIVLGLIKMRLKNISEYD